MRLVLLGPPGAGKGTQAESIVKKYNIPAISTGDIFRANIAGETELGKKCKAYLDKGELVPDSVVDEIVVDRLSQDDCKEGFLLDGYPRTVGQADAFQKVMESKNECLDRVINISVEKETLMTRATGRRICTNCKKVYHTEFSPTQVEGVCDVCGGEVVRRSDDEPEKVLRRIEVYIEQTQPLIDYYTKKNLLVTVDGNQLVEKVFSDIVNALGDKHDFD